MSQIEQPPIKMIKLIRHGESEANSEGRWQGLLDSELSARGVGQARRLGGRFQNDSAMRVVASDLSRAMETAAFLTDGAVPDAAWREHDIGTWEGMTTQQITERFPQDIEALFAGEDVAPGGGELQSSFTRRVVEAFDTLVASMRDGDTAHVITHGGVIRTLLTHVLGRPNQNRSLSISANTGVTVISVSGAEQPQLAVFNDATHLGQTAVDLGRRGRTVTLFRHGETESNRLKRWHGRTDSPLSDRGREQAMAARAQVPVVGQLFCSPLGRARETAEILGEPQGLTPTIDNGLIELSFGAWENFTRDEARLADPITFAQIFGRGIDLPFGGDGETFVHAAKRMSSAVEAIIDAAEGDVVVVSHAAVTRAYVASTIGLGFSDRDRLVAPRNTALSSVLYTDAKPTLMSYNIAPHLDV